ncbi:diadenylate cyclase [Bacillus cereus]|nr:diadenylate cyclase [Bacillus cereus]
MVNVPDNQNPTEFFQQKLSLIKDIFKNVTGMPLTLEITKKSTVDARCAFQTKNSSLNKQVAYQLLNSLLNHLEETFNEDTYKAKSLYNLPLDLSMLLIFPEFAQLTEEKKYEYLTFTNNLIELSNRTYELESPSIGIIYCSSENKIEHVYKQIEWEYIPYKEEYELINFFKIFKPSIKLFDNKSLTLLVNHNFKIIGMLRKNTNQKSISHTLENKYLKNNKDQYLIHLTSFINEFTKNKVSKKVANQLFARISDSIPNSGKLTAMEILRFISNFNKISPSTIKKLKEVRDKNMPEFTFITIGKNEVNFHTKNNFVVSYNKGSWKIKHFTLLLAYIFEFLIPSQELFLYKLRISDEEKLFQLYTDILDNIQLLIKHIKALSDYNKGALIVILDKNNRKNLSAEECKNCINEFLEVQDTNAQQISNKIITLNNKNIMNLNDIDYYLFQSIASIDGAVILDKNFNILSYGQIIKKSKNKNSDSTETKNVFGARTVAAAEASYSGIAIKVSEDGDIQIYKNGKNTFTL